MGKIKNQTREQKEIHNRAVKIRKMTDEELVRRFDAVKHTVTPGDNKMAENMVKLACAAGASVKQLNVENMTKSACAAGVSIEQLSTKKADCVEEYSVKEFLHDLEEADLRGIGKITIKKISEFAKEKGYI